MMLLVDVVKIKCKFVSEWIAFLNKRKYSVSACYKCKYTYYADAIKVLYGIENSPLEGYAVSNCLEHTDECDLITKAAKYPEQVDCTTGEECLEQVAITLSKANYTCNAVSETINPVCNCKYPTSFATNNSELVNARINIKTTFSGVCSNPSTTSSETVEGGCDSVGGCIDANQSYYSFGFNSNSTSIVTADSYITQMRVYATDGYGAITTMYNLNLNPITSPYLVDDPVLCPGCTTVLASELEFGDPNFTDAFETLMDNVSLALFGVTGLHRMYAWWNGTHYRIRSKAVHNPTGTHLFGINRNDSNLIVVTPTSNYTQGINAYGDFDAAPHYAPIRFYHESAEITAPGTLYACANITPIIEDQIIYPNYNTLTSNFNKIVFNAPLSSYPIEVSEGTSESCESVILSASYTTDKTIDSVEWEDPNNITLSTSTLASAQENGTHTFYLNLENGCTISETIEVTEF